MKICNGCGKDFKYASVLKRHLERKTPCVFDNIANGDYEHVCGRCGRPFKEKRYLSAHLKRSCRDGAPADINLQNKQTVGNGNVIKGNNNVMNNINVNLVNINPFHETSTECITPEVLKEIIERSSGNINALITNLLAKIYRTPENRNVYLKKDGKSPLAAILVRGEDGPKWEVLPADAVHPPMVDTSVRAYYGTYNEATKTDMGAPDKLRADNMADELDAACPNDKGPSPSL